MHRPFSFALTLIASTALGGCALFPRHINPPVSVFSDTSLTASRSEAAGAVPAGTTLITGLETDLVTAWLALAKATAANEATLGSSFLLKGVSLVDARCDQYFLALGLAAQKLSFANKELGLTTGLVAALQGLTSVGAKEIAITASGLGFLGASSTAYGEVFIFSPEVSSVQALVAASQAAAKARIDQLAPADFSKATAINLLQDYEKTCEVHTIRRLVNESLVSAKPIAAFAAEEPQFVALRMATQDALAKLLKVDQVSDDQLTALYWFSYKPAPPPAELTIQEQQLAGFPEMVDSAGKLKSGAQLSTLRVGINAALRGLVVSSLSRLESDLVAMKQAGAAAVAGAAGAGVLAAAGGAPSVARVASRKFAPSLTVRVLPAGR